MTASGRLWHVVGVLAGVLGLRMLGLFIVLPVLALHARTLAGATPALVGLAVGAYGITQAAFQVPAGALSDRWGRVRIMLAGLAVFAAGSVLAALAHDIWLLIVGRILQGAGAISAAGLALIADLTPSGQRHRAMALVGVTIGGAFVLAIVLGPLLGGRFGVPALFWLTAALAVVAALALHFSVIEPAVPVNGQDATDGTVGDAPSNGTRFNTPALRGLHVGIFLLHFILTATFVAVPVELHDRHHLATAEHWRVYLPALLVSFTLTAALLWAADRGNRHARVFGAGLLLLGLGLVALALPGSGVLAAAGGLILFFGGFNFLEAHLPVRVAEEAPVAARGAAMGVYATLQFLGAFAGGVAGGWALGYGGAGPLWLATAAVVAWAVVQAVMTGQVDRRSTPH